MPKKQQTAVWSWHLDILSGIVSIEIERRLDVVGKRDDAHSDAATLDVEAGDETRDETAHVLEVRMVDAARRVQHEYDVRLVHALCSRRIVIYFIYLFIY